MKKIWIFLVTMVMMVVLIGGSIMPANATTGSRTSNEATVTRLEWLKALTEAFQMEVEEQNYPDNYYTDVDASSEDYYDIMLATEFGLVDVEAGGELRPEDPATREFAAHTLNLCMGYFLDEEAEYTFSEADSVTYPDDIQIAINKGWIALSGDDFLPNQGITIAEKDKMIDAAEAVVASTVIDEDYEGSYELVDGVIVVPEGTEVMLTNENELTIYECPVELKTGDVFVVFSDGFPVARRAVTISKDDDVTVVTVESVEYEDAFVSIDMQGTVTADLTQIQPVDDSVELAYIVGGTEEAAYQDGVTFYSLREVGDQKVTAVVATKEVAVPKKTRATTETDATDYISVKCTISNITKDYSIGLDESYFKVNGTVTFSFNMSTGDLPLFGYEDSFVKVPIGAFGYFQPAVECNISGSMSLCMENQVSVGVQWTQKNGARITSDFKKKAFTIQACVEGKLGVKVAIGVDLVAIKAEAYATAGAKVGVALTTYTDEQLPRECIHVSAHMYASIGVEASIGIGFLKLEVEQEKEFINEKNSPIKLVYHYEDGNPVAECTRDVEEEGSGGSSSESGTSKKYNYYTPINSQYVYTGLNTGKTLTGETYTIFEYSLDKNNQATITKYNGNVSALTIPSTIDGYTVVGIGKTVFKNNKRLYVVDIPNSVSEIGEGAFGNCTNLFSVKLSKSLTKMGAHAFYNCDNLTSIEIPKSLEETYDAYINEFAYNYQSGPFYGCDGLKTVKFEDGITTIANGLFANCPGIEEITIPDTVTVIESKAFLNCDSLKNVKISSHVTSIGSMAFAKSEILEEITIPDSVTYIADGVFGNCVGLSKVKLSKALTKMGAHAFYNCDALTSIEIPKNLIETHDSYINEFAYDYQDGPFYSCTNLKTVTFEEGCITIANGLFANCPGLEEIVIPDSIRVIERKAFFNCNNLKNVKMSNSTTGIESMAFAYSEALEEITIPDSVTYIADGVFGNCTGLSKVKLSKALTKMGAHAFYNCDSLTSIEIPKSLVETHDAYIYDFAYNYQFGPFYACNGLKTVNFEEGATTIANGLFANCPGIEEVSIPNTIKVIETNAFLNCTGLKKVTLLDNLKTIEGNAFKNCSSLQAISIPDTVTGMGTYIFAGCTSLASAKLPNGRVTLTEGTFQNCSALTSIELPSTLETIGSYAFQNSGLKSIIIPEKVNEIYSRAFQKTPLESVTFHSKLEWLSDYAFCDCDFLQAVTIPDSVTWIGTYCFAACELLADIKLGTGITTINNYAFYLCPSLEEIVLPYYVNTVEANAFSNCTALKKVAIPRATTTIEANAFSYPTEMTVYGISGTYAEEWANSVGATFVYKEQPATSVLLSKEALTMFTNEKQKLEIKIEPYDFTDIIAWKTSNEDVVTVSNKGVVTAVGTGKAIIRVMVGDKSASCVVTVLQPVTSIYLDESYRTMKAEEEFTLSASIYPDNANDRTVTWSSSDESVVTIDQNGRATALKKGTATITVKANDGSNCYDTCDITVENSHYYCDTIEQMESAHNYEINCKDMWIYKLEGANQLEVTFDERTNVEELFDFIYLYDAKGLIRDYTGMELAGKTILVDGDTIKVELDTDNAGNEWGFKVTSIKEYCEHTYANIWSGDEIHHWYASTCGHAYAVKDKAEHTLTDWIIDKEATTETAGSKHMECLVCKRTVKTESIPQLRDYVKELEDRLTAAVNQSIEAAANLTPENYVNATEEEKKQAVENVLNQISSSCTAQDIDELGILPVDTALTLVGNVTQVEQQIAELLNTSVSVVSKDVQQTLALPTIQNALLSVDAGENATIKVGEVQSPTVEGVDLSNAVALTLELFNSADEKMSLKAPVIVTLPIPAGIDANEKISIYHFHEGSTDYNEIIPVKVDVANNTITFVTGSFSTFTVTNVPTGVEVSGIITSFGEASAQINVQLIDGGGNIVSETNVTGNSATYSLSEIPAGTYTMSISKNSHVTRTYTIIVGDTAVSQDMKIQLKGDITGDGVINARDKKTLFNHIAGTSKLTDYAFAVADVNDDGVINARDKKMVFNHIAGTNSLWK